MCGCWTRTGTELAHFHGISHTGEFLIYISVCESSKIKSAESDFSTAYYE